MSNFGHLHIHTEYSMLDGMCKLNELFNTINELGQNFCAITDHGSTSAWWNSQKLANQANVKVLLGTEFYCERENDGGNGHLIAIAKNNEGIKNIFKLQEFGYTKNFYYKPRINKEILKAHKEGLIITSACLASTINQYIINGEISEAIQWARDYQNIFGEDFYLEIQPNNIPEQLIVNQKIIQIAKSLNIKTVATNDVHYILEQDAFPHEVLLAMQINKKMSDEKRWKFDTVDFWLKSEKEMHDTFIGISEDDVKTAMENTLEIADKCNASLERGKYLPKYYNIPPNKTEREILAHHIREGARIKGFSKNNQYMTDVQYELDVIDRNGYSGYFLIVQDYVTTARKNGIIVGDGRGSGAGSKVAYLTDITRIEPQQYDLLFERFLADGREPDFDVDFSDQDAVFVDLQNKYGENNVARIIAFGTLAPKAVFRKVMSTFDHDTSTINNISKLISATYNTLKEAISDSKELQTYKEKYKTEFQVMERIEGTVSHESQHAGGIIIQPNLSSILPIITKSEDRQKRIVAFDKYMLEDMGHFKFDVLGLETLPVIKRCLDSIEGDIDSVIDLYTIDFNDSKVYDMLCKGYVSGIFQLSNQAQKVIEQQPRNFKDLIAINALIRPGTGDWHEYIARRKGKPWTVIPERMPYLKETEGLITYQEQFLLDCKTLAGWDVAYADKHVRKNKDIKNDKELYQKFWQDCSDNGYDDDIINKSWDEICDAVAGGYSFNKSHSASYAIISYQTAWLKCYYPKHFYASLMSSEKTDGKGQYAIANYITECKNMGINILPPDINNSNVTFNVTDNGINYRISTIKHVGGSAVNYIFSMRPIKSFEDFLQRREKQHIKQNVLVNLVKAGCFDFDNTNRSELLWKADMANRTNKQIKENFEFPRYEWNDKIKAEWEKEVLGMYLSSHPLEKFGFYPLSHFKNNEIALQGGEVNEVKTFKDKNKQDMAFMFIDTLFGNLKVIIFQSTWKKDNVKNLCIPGNLVMIKGAKSGDGIILNEIELLN